MPGSPKSRDDSYDRDCARRGADKRSTHSVDRDRSHSRDRSRSPLKSKKPTARRVFVSNIPYEYHWQELKDLFRDEVGEVSYVELFMDDNDRPKGCGIVEFKTLENAQKAVEKMHRYDLKGRKLVVKEDTVERDKVGRTAGNRSSGGVGSGAGNMSRWEAPGGSVGGASKWGNTYGLSPAFLDSLNITGPLISKVFVANLDYKVDEKKLKEVFKLAGRLISVDLAMDKDGKSRGFGTVEYEHPVEAVQAISMFHNQMLYDRRINVRMDKSNENAGGPPKLPEGLKSIGMGLGPNGIPLTDVSRNLPSLNLSNVQPPPNPLPSTAPSSALAALGSAALASLGQNQIGSAFGSLDSRLLDTAIARRQLEMMLAGGGAGDLGLRSSAFSSSLSGSVGSGTPYLHGRESLPYSASASGGLGGRDYDSLPLSSGNASAVPFSDYDYKSAGSIDRKLKQLTDTILISNLPLSVTWQVLRERMRDFGEIKYIDVKDNETGIVRFSTEREAERAISLLDRTRWDGRVIEVTPY